MNKYQHNASANTNGKNTQNKVTRVNYNIKSKLCRVIEAGKTPRIMNTAAAIAYAESCNLDLIEVGYDKSNNCSNCKVLDWSKYQYEQKKKAKEAKKQAKANIAEVKSVQFTLTTDVADKNRIIKHAKEFIAKGDKVKISLRFRNRYESANIDMAKNMMKEFLKEFDGLAVLDSNPSVCGKELSCIIRHA